MTLVGDAILREPSDPWTDFKARLFVGIFITIFLLMLSYGNIKYAEITEGRWFRDMTNQTPFHSVIVNHMERSEYELIIRGTLVKSRDCQTFGPVIAQVIKDGIAHAAIFTNEGENGKSTTSRPVMSMPQTFGPWHVLSPVSWPDRAIMYRTHVCGEQYQTNVVFDQEWGMP